MSHQTSLTYAITNGTVKNSVIEECIDTHGKCIVILFNSKLTNELLEFKSYKSTNQVSRKQYSKIMRGPIIRMVFVNDATSCK